MSAVFVCADLTDECWWCSDPLRTIRRALGQPVANEFGGTYCSTDCADRAAEDRLRGDRRCTVCMKPEGRCSTDHPEDPHDYEPLAATPPTSPAVVPDDDAAGGAS